MKKFLKSLIRSLATVVCIFILGNVSNASNKILAMVGEDIITTNNLEKRYMALIKTNNLSPPPDEIKSLKTQLLHSLINEKVIMHEARRLKINISDKEIKAAIADIEYSQGLPAGSFIKHHEEYGITKNDLWEQMRVKLSWQRILVDFILPTYGQNSVSDTALNEFVVQNYPEAIKIAGFIYKFGKEKTKVIKDLYKIRKDSLCDIKNLQQIAGNVPEQINSSLKQIKDAKIRQIVSFAQNIPGIVTAEEGNKIVLLVLCKKKPTISEKELNKIRMELKNKKMELYTEHYLKNLKKKMAIKINEQYI